MAQPPSTFGRRLLSFFVTDAPTDAGTPAPNSPTGKPAPTNPPVGTTAAPIVTGTPDPKFIAHFAEVLTKANLPGPDYFEFRETLQSLSALGLSEEKQMQAAWASIKSLSGLTDPGVLRSSAAQYLTVVRQDRDAFMKTADAALAERTGSLQAEEARLKAENDALTKQLADIQAKLKANADRLAQIGTEQGEQTDKIRQNRANFEAAYETISSQIAADVEKINAHLK
jgi:cytochrome c556